MSSNFLKHFSLIPAIFFVFLFFSPSPVRAAPDTCFCYSNIEKALKELGISGQLEDAAFRIDAECAQNKLSKCTAAEFIEVYGKDNLLYLTCDGMPTEWADCEKKLEAWGKQLEAAKASQSRVKETYMGRTQGEIIPECLMDDKLTNPACKDVSIFVVTLINLSDYLFSIIGALALVTYIYGGFVVVLSHGNNEKVKKGYEAIVAATIGLVIVFGAYMLVQFLGNAIGLEGAFKLK